MGMLATVEFLFIMLLAASTNGWLRLTWPPILSLIGPVCCFGVFVILGFGMKLIMPTVEHKLSIWSVMCFFCSAVYSVVLMWADFVYGLEVLTVFTGICLAVAAIGWWRDEEIPMETHAS